MVAHGGMEEGGGEMVAVRERGDMSFDQRAAISAGAGKLSANNLSKVIEIIRTNMPTLGHGEKEIEIDINAFDNSTCGCTTT